MLSTSRPSRFVIACEKIPWGVCVCVCVCVFMYICVCMGVDGWMDVFLLFLSLEGMDFDVFAIALYTYM